MAMQPPPQPTHQIMQAEQMKGTQAQRDNFTAVEVITEILKTSLGKNGMDKMLVDSLGDSIITNDGATILQELDIAHPAARILIEASTATDSEVGDGTTSTAILIGAILAEAKDLISKDIHPNVIIKTLKKTLQESIACLQKNSTGIDIGDMQELEQVVNTTLASKVVSEDSDILARLVIDAVLAVTKDGRPDLSAIKVEKMRGKGIRDSKLIKGVILDKEVVHAGMPTKIVNAKIALINTILEVKKSEMDSHINMAPDQASSLIDEETKQLRKMAEDITKTGANVVVCQKGIDDIVQHYLEKAGVLAIRRVKPTDMNILQKCTGGKIINTLDDFSRDDLGEAKLVEEKVLDDETTWVYFEECKNPNALTIVLHGGNQQIIDEMERSIHDAVMVVKDVIRVPRVLPGAGYSEILLYQSILNWGKSLDGRERLVAKAVANAYLCIPKTLAHNAGMDPIDTEIDIESLTEPACVNIGQGCIGAVEGVMEPLAVKTQILNSAIEACIMILRIDNILRSNKQPTPQ